MPEIVIESSSPLKSAIAKVTSNGRDAWQLVDWTTPGTGARPTKIADTLSHNNATSGLRGTVTHPNGTTRNFTIRHDYDYAKGMPPSGKGYHVNVELPHEKYAFACKTMSERYFADCVQMLSERRLHDGDVEASRWFMNANSNAGL